MTARDQQRMRILTRVLEGSLTMAEGATLLNLFQWSNVGLMIQRPLAKSLA